MWFKTSRIEQNLKAKTSRIEQNFKSQKAEFVSENLVTLKQSQARVKRARASVVNQFQLFTEKVELDCSSDSKAK